ncbi:MAG: putative acyltransferase [Phycisphaerales bacterium]|nr:putative acyltransferase [Phycisphaerales bacterium]
MNQSRRVVRQIEKVKAHFHWITNQTELASEIGRMGCDPLETPLGRPFTRSGVRGILCATGTGQSLQTRKPIMDGVIARRATLDEIFQVRWDVLRAGCPVEAARFPGDDAPETILVGAFVGERNVSCATATRAQWEGRPAWQLGGMGVVADWQKRGVGQRVLATLEDLVRRASDVRQIWCNAREEAVAFYEKQGWVLASERFQVEGVGPHFKMTKTL